MTSLLCLACLLLGLSVDQKGPVDVVSRARFVEAAAAAFLFVTVAFAVVFR